MFLMAVLLGSPTMPKSVKTLGTGQAREASAANLDEQTLCSLLSLLQLFAAGSPCADGIGFCPQHLVVTQPVAPLSQGLQTRTQDMFQGSPSGTVGTGTVFLPDPSGKGWVVWGGRNKPLAKQMLISMRLPN